MRFHKFIRTTMYRRYLIFFLTLFFVLYGVQAYLNKQNMVIAIQEIQEEIDDTKNEATFIKNFEIPYLASEWAKYYLGHENGQIYDGEWVVRLRNRDKLSDDQLPNDILALQEKEEDVIIISSPEESRYYFIYDKLKPLKDLGLIE